MPAKFHNKKRSTQRRPVEKAPAVESGTAKPTDSTAAASTATTPSATGRPAARPVSATQVAPRRYYLGKELVRVLVVTVVTTAILFGAWWFLR